MVFRAWSARIASASVFTPGTTMWLPMRYTASMPSVKSTRFLSSPTWKMLRKLSIIRELPPCRPPRQSSRRPSARAEPFLAQESRRDGRARVEPLGDSVDVHDDVFLAEQVREAALRHA